MRAGNSRRTLPSRSAGVCRECESGAVTRSSPDPFALRPRSPSTVGRFAGGPAEGTEWFADPLASAAGQAVLEDPRCRAGAARADAEMMHVLDVFFRFANGEGEVVADDIEPGREDQPG